MGVIRNRTENGDYRVEYPSGKQDIYTYTELINVLNKADDDREERWMFDEIAGHRKVGNHIELLIQWDTREMTWEPLSNIKRDDPITIAKYTKEKELLNE